jgi:hypothetical protein
MAAARETCRSGRVDDPLRVWCGNLKHGTPSRVVDQVLAAYSCVNVVDTAMFRSRKVCSGSTTNDDSAILTFADEISASRATGFLNGLSDCGMEWPGKKLAARYASMIAPTVWYPPTTPTPPPPPVRESAPVLTPSHHWDDQSWDCERVVRVLVAERW